MEQSVLIVAIFVGAGLLAYVLVPGFLLIWDRILDAMSRTEEEEKR